MNMQTRRGLLLAAAGILVVTAFVRAWFAGHGVSLGLWGIEVEGHGVRWDNTGADLDIYLAPYLAFAGALVSAALTALCALKGAAAPIAAARTLLTITAVLMIAFVVRIFLDSVPGASISWAAFLGPVAAIGARQLVGKPQ